jgi:hypothetical protein
MNELYENENECEHGRDEQKHEGKHEQEHQHEHKKLLNESEQQRF